MMSLWETLIVQNSCKVCKNDPINPIIFRPSFVESLCQWSDLCLGLLLRSRRVLACDEVSLSNTLKHSHLSLPKDQSDRDGCLSFRSVLRKNGWSKAFCQHWLRGPTSYLRRCPKKRCVSLQTVCSKADLKAHLVSETIAPRPSVKVENQPCYTVVFLWWHIIWLVLTLHLPLVVAVAPKMCRCIRTVRVVCSCRSYYHLGGSRVSEE